MRINLVTGATGLVGAYLIKALIEKGEKVKALYRTEASRNAFLFPNLTKDVEWVQADVLDIPALTEAFHAVTHVYHAAAVVSFDPQQRDWMFKVNVEGTSNVVNTALATPSVQKLLFVSSVAALDKKSKASTIINEEASFLKKGSDYGMSKQAAEREAWRAHYEGLPTVIVNPATILGFGDWHKSSCRIFKKLSEGLKYTPTGANAWVGVRDVADMTVALMHHEAAVGQRFILAAENASFKTVFTQIAQAFGVKPPHKTLPNWLAQIAWRAELVWSIIRNQPPRITKSSIRTAQKVRAYDGTKVAQFLGVEYTPIDKVIEEAVAMYKR